MASVTSAFKRMWLYIQWLYFQYTIHLAVSTMDPWETCIFNSTVVLLLSLTAYTTYLFLPGHVYMWINNFRWISQYIMASWTQSDATAGASTVASLSAAHD